MAVITRPWTAAELEAAELGVMWLAALSWQGVTWLHAQRTTHAPGPDGGATTLWTGGLSGVRYTATCEPYRYDSALRSARCSIVPHPALPVPRRLSRDRAALQGASLALYRWIVGSSTLRLVIEGEVDSYSYEPTARAPLTLAIKERPWRDSALLLPRTAAISSDTFSSPSDTTDAEPYPVVIGEPGASTGAAGSVALPTGVSSRVLINGGAVAATTVTLHDQDGLSESFSVAQGLDDLGQLYSYCDLSAAGTLTYADDARFWTQWQSARGAQVGVDGQGLRTLGQALAWLAQRTGVRWDVPRLEGLAPALPFRIDATLQGKPDAGLTAWAALQDLATDWPVALRAMGDRLKLLLWDPYRPRYRAALEHDVRGVRQLRGPQRSGAARKAPTVYVAPYAQDPITGDYTRQAELVPSDRLGYSASAVVSGQLERAWLASGRRVVEERVDLPTVWDATAAAYILEARAAWNARGGETIRVQVPRYISIEAGDEVTWTRADASVTCARAWVSSVQVDGAGSQLCLLRLLPRY